MDTIYVETERLILRSWRSDDVERFVEMNGNLNVMRYFPAPLSVDESNAFVCRIIAELEETGFGLYAVELRESGEFIGYVGFHRFAFEAPFSPGWEIGWRISDKFWHRGYATEAAMACIKHARQKKLCHRLYSFTAVPNHASENVMKRIGMKFEGLFMHPALADGHWLREHKLYVMEIGK